MVRSTRTYFNTDRSSSMLKHIIAGLGFVGKEVSNLFPNAVAYDIMYPDSAVLLKDTWDFCHICVPTPMKENGSCDTSAVEDVIKKIKANVFIIRSTVPPGFTSTVPNAVFQPEYVASSSPYPAPLADVKTRGFIILGGDKKNTKKVRGLYETIFPPTVDIMEVTAIEAELIKLFENTAIAAKVTLSQEFYEICKAFGVDYSVIQQGVFGADPRFNKFFTNVYADKRGFSSSHCLPKDLSNLVNSCKERGYNPRFVIDILENNERWKNG